MPGTDRTDEQAQFFANRLKKRFKHLWKYARRMETNAFRVYHRDIPELPFAVDWYDGHLHIAEYDRPHERSEQEHALWVDTMVDTAARALTVAPERVFLKRRFRLAGDAQYEPVSSRGYTIPIEEQGLEFIVNLSDYVDTGLFLDHRLLRQWVARRATGRRVLNLFCYTGAFTVYAAAAAARSTVSIDMSNTYLAWAEQNLVRNGLMSSEHELRRADVLADLERMAGSRERFDLIVLDPPTFSNSKKMQRTFDVQRDHRDLINRCIGLLTPGGILVFATNKRRFQFDRAGIASPDIRKLTKLTMPEDFAGSTIHQVWSIAAPS